MDGWNTSLSYWVSAYFQGLWPLVSGRVSPLNWRLARRDWTSTGSVSKGGFGGFFGNPPKFGDEQRCWGVFQIIFKKVDNFEDFFLTRIYCLGDFFVDFTKGFNTIMAHLLGRIRIEVRRKSKFKKRILPAEYDIHWMWPPPRMPVTTRIII